MKPKTVTRQRTYNCCNAKISCAFNTINLICSQVDLSVELAVYYVTFYFRNDGWEGRNRYIEVRVGNVPATNANDMRDNPVAGNLAGTAGMATIADVSTFQICPVVLKTRMQRLSRLSSY